MFPDFSLKWNSHKAMHEGFFFPNFATRWSHNCTRLFSSNFPTFGNKCLGGLCQSLLLSPAQAWTRISLNKHELIHKHLSKCFPKSEILVDNRSLTYDVRRNVKRTLANFSCSHLPHPSAILRIPNSSVISFSIHPSYLLSSDPVTPNFLSIVVVFQWLIFVNCDSLKLFRVLLKWIPFREVHTCHWWIYGF